MSLKFKKYMILYYKTNTDVGQNTISVQKKENNMSALVEVKDICKIYNPGENEVRALDHVSLSIETGEFVAIIGQSGSGKSTLMNMLGAWTRPLQELIF